MKAKQLTLLSSRMTDVYDRLQMHILKNIIDRLQDDTLDQVTRDNVLKWQTQKMLELGDFTNDTVKYVSKMSGKSDAVINEILSEVRKAINENVEPKLQKVTHREKPPATTTADYILDGLGRVAKDNIDNLVNQRLITRNVHNNSASRAYTQILNDACARVLVGADENVQTSLYDAVYKFQAKGLESGLIDKAGHRWTIDGYVKTVMNSTIPQAYAKTTQQRMDDYGYSLVVYPSHASARPACAPIQGQIVNLKSPGDSGFVKGYDSVYNHGYGKPSGALGINCSHWHFTIYVPGESTNNAPAIDPDKAIKQYGLQQRQRQMERAIRLTKQRQAIASHMNDNDGQSRLSSLLRSQQSAIRQFTKQNGLVRQYQNERIP